MTSFHLIRRWHHDEPITVLDLLRLLDTDHVSKKVRAVRDTITAPYCVPDQAAFEELLFAFYNAHHQTAYGVDLRAVHQNDPNGRKFDRYEALRFAQDLLGSYDNLLRAEHNAIKGRDGGVPGVLDALCVGLTRHLADTHTSLTLLECLPPSDYAVRQQVATVLLEQIAPQLFPGEEFKHIMFAVFDLEPFVLRCAKALAALDRHWR